MKVSFISEFNIPTSHNTYIVSFPSVILRILFFLIPGRVFGKAKARMYNFLISQFAKANDITI